MTSRYAQGGTCVAEGIGSAKLQYTLSAVLKAYTSMFTHLLGIVDGQLILQFPHDSKV